MKDRYQISLKLILRDARGRILALAKDSGSFAGLYDFPGGRIEVDEFETPFADILRREAHEELGEIAFDLGEAPVAAGRHRIPASADANGASAPEVHVLYLFFEGRHLGGDVRVSEEHSGFDWLDYEEAAATPEKFFSSGNLEGMRTYAAIRRSG